MARATTIYGSSESQAFIINETEAMTANVTTMLGIPLTGVPSVNENAFRDSDKKLSVGRTIKSADVVVITKGQVKEISFQTYLDETLYMNWLQNGGGKVVEVGAPIGAFVAAFNHTPAACGNAGEFTDWTGTMTFAYVPPYAAEAQIFAGCVVDSMKLAMAQGTEGGRPIIDVVLKTRVEVSSGQATPASTVAYTKSALTIYDLCTTTQVNSIDVQLNSLEFTHNFNTKHAGVACDGKATAIAKNIPVIDLTGVVVCLVDTNLPQAHELARAATTIPLSFTNGANFFFTVATALVTADVQASDNDDYQVWSIPWQATAGTSGNLFEEEIKTPA